MIHPLTLVLQVRQVCSGMWGQGKQSPFIEGALPNSGLPRGSTNPAHRSCLAAVLFSPASRGQAALVIFEWQDSKYLGVNPEGEPKLNDWAEDVRRPSCFEALNGPRLI